MALRWLEFGPESLADITHVRVSTIKRMLTLVLMLGVLSVFLAGVTYVSYEVAVFDDQAKSATRNVLSGASSRS